MGSWTDDTANPLLHATYEATSVAYNGYIYEIGGYTTTQTAEVDYAPLNANGTVGSWTATTSLLHATDYATSVAYNGYLYEIGGTHPRSHRRGRLRPPATPTAQWARGRPLPACSTPPSRPRSVAYNGYLYEIGGYTTTKTAEVDYAPLNANGTVGSWTATTSLLHATAQAASVAYNGYLYDIGG